MGSDTESRIAMRTRWATERIQSQGTLGQFWTLARMNIANTVDRITGWADDDRVVFMGASLGGMLRGAVYGALLGAFIIACSITAAHVGALVLFGSMLACAVGWGIYEGQAKLEDHINKGHREPAKAIEGNAQNLARTQEQPAQTPVASPAPPRDANFAAREAARRANPGTLQQGG